MLDKIEITLPSLTDFLIYLFAILFIVYSCLFLISKLRLQSLKSKLLEQEDNNESEEEGQKAIPKENQEYVAFCVEMVKLLQQAVDIFFKNSWIIGILICFLMSIPIFFFFEEKLGTAYITVAYIVGVLTCLIVSMFAKTLIKYGHFELFVNSNERKIKSLEIAIESGVAVIAFFLGFVIFLLKSGLIIYIDLYGDDNKTLQKLFIFLFVGFAIGYISLIITQRVALAIINQAATLANNNSLSTPPINQLSNTQVDIYSIQTPGSSVNIFKEYLTSTIMTICDFTAIIVFVIAIVMIALTDSEEFLKEKNSNNFLLFMIEYSLLSTYTSFLITRLVYHSNKVYNENNESDLIEAIANFVRCFIIISFFFAIGGYFLFSFMFFPDKITTGFSKNAKAVEAAKKFLLISNQNAQETVLLDAEKGANQWLILMCFLFSLVFSVILMPLGEYLTSHCYKPVRNLSRSLTDNLFFAYPYSNSLLPISFVLGYLLILAVTFFLIHWLVGYIGIAVLCFGFFPIILTLFAVHVASTLLTTVYTLHCQMKSEEGQIPFIFNIIFPLNNYKIHYEIILSVMFSIIGYVTIAVYWHFSADYDKMLSFTPIMIFGALIGMALIWVFSVEIISSSMNPATKLLYNFRKQAIKMQEELSYKPTDDISSHIEDLSSSSLQSLFSPIITSIVTTMFFGLLFGNDIMFGYIIGIIIFVAIKLVHCIIYGNALINAKNFIQNEFSIISKTDGIYPSQLLAHSIGELQKNQIFSLITLALFTICLTLISEPLFSSTGWLAAKWKLDLKNMQSGGPW